MFFITPLSLSSENVSLPSKTICLTLAFGPSSMMKESCWPEPPMVLASWRTVAKGRPLAASISLMIDWTLFALAWS